MTIVWVPSGLVVVVVVVGIVVSVGVVVVAGAVVSDRLGAGIPSITIFTVFSYLHRVLLFPRQGKKRIREGMPSFPQLLMAL